MSGKGTARVTPAPESCCESLQLCEREQSFESQQSNIQRSTESEPDKSQIGSDFTPTFINGRQFRTPSILELHNDAKATPTLLQDIIHIFTWTFKLVPLILMLVVSIGLNDAFTYYIDPFLKDDSPASPLMVYFVMGDVYFTVFIVLTYLNFELHPFSIALIVLGKSACTASLLMVCVQQGFPWNDQMSLFILCLIFGISAFLQSFIAQIIEGGRACSKPTILTSLLMGVVGWSSVFVIFQYGYVVSHITDWLMEMIITGILYPIICILVGRFLVADVVSFVLLWMFPNGSRRTIMSGYTLLVKIAFYFSGQTAILFLQSPYAFALSIFITSLTELLGTYANIKATLYMQKKLKSRQEGPVPRTTFVTMLVIRADLATERLLLHMHDEGLGEKVVIFAATFVAIYMSINYGVSPVGVCIRGLILAFVEHGQDLCQRRILYQLTGLNLAVIKPKILPLQESLLILCSILLTLNFFRATVSDRNWT